MQNPAILVINGSARDSSNTELAITHLCPFKKFELVNLRQISLAHYNYTEPMKDDFLDIAERMSRAQAIVYATPVYWYAMSGLMKVFFDRLTELITTQKSLGRKLGGKDTYLIAQGSDPDMPDGFLVPFERTARYFDMNFVGHFYMSIEN